jgi:hypothetical protein
MHSTKLCILYAFIALLVGLVIGYIAKKNEWLGKEYYGEIMDRMCMSGNCSNQTGIQKATQDCIAERTKVFGTRMTSACNHPDPEIRAMICPETCDVNDVASYILQKPDLGCSQPLKLGYADAYDYNKGKYIKQAYCMTQSGYIRYPAGDPKEEKVEKESYKY